MLRLGSVQIETAECWLKIASESTNERLEWCSYEKFGLGCDNILSKVIAGCSENKKCTWGIGVVAFLNFKKPVQAELTCRFVYKRRES